MKNFVYLSFLVIFVSMILILMVFDNFSNFIVFCQTSECSDNQMFFTMLFGFFVTAIFVIIDTLVTVVIIREKPWRAGEASQAYKKASTKNNHNKHNLAGLKDELDSLNRSKEETEKQYYKGKFNQKTFERMLNNYDQKIIEVKSRMKNIKSKSK